MHCHKCFVKHCLDEKGSRPPDWRARNLWRRGRFYAAKALIIGSMREFQDLVLLRVVYHKDVVLVGTSNRMKTCIQLTLGCNFLNCRGNSCKSHKHERIFTMTYGVLRTMKSFTATLQFQIHFEHCNAMYWP